MGVLRIGDLVILVVTVNKILHDGSAFKDTDLIPIVACIRDCRDSAIRVDVVQVPRLFLLIVHQLHVM